MLGISLRQPHGNHIPTTDNLVPVQRWLPFSTDSLLCNYKNKSRSGVDTAYIQKQVVCTFSL